MKIIKCELDTESLDKAIKELQEYRENIENKVIEFVNLLLQDGIAVANAKLGSTIGDSTDATVGFSVNDDGEVVSAEINLTGTEALFIEFGAGIAYNTGAQHPQASEFGYGPGTYPSKHPPNRAINPGRWIYGHNDDGSPIWSIGTQASMPIYHASEEMRNKVIQRAKEVFKN